MTDNIPTAIILTAHTIATISHEARASTNGTETGGILLGTLEPHGVVVRHAGQPGPCAIRKTDFFQRDLGYAQTLGNQAFVADRSIWIGEWHTHLHAPPRPSSVDLTTYRRLLNDPELDFDYIVSIILADATGDWSAPQITGWIITPKRVKEVLNEILPDDGTDESHDAAATLG